ncbi:MAG: hypothetical protein CUN53_12720, partial [Phototrophicales bacterium]
LRTGLSSDRSGVAKQTGIKRGRSEHCDGFVPPGQTAECLFGKMITPFSRLAIKSDVNQQNMLELLLSLRIQSDIRIVLSPSTADGRLKIVFKRQIPT